MSEDSNIPSASEPKDTIWWRIVNLQPATWRGIVTAVFVLLAAVGIKVVPEVPDAVFLVILAVLPVIQAAWTKKAVTPNAKVAVRVPDPINRPGKIEAGPAVVDIEVSHTDELNWQTSQLIEVAGTAGK